MNLAILTKSATTKSGAKVPFELALHLTALKFSSITVFAQKKKAENDLKKKLAIQNVKLVLYNDPIDLYRKLKQANIDLISFHATFPEMITAKFIFKPIIQTYYGTQFGGYLEKFTPDQKPSSFQKILNFIFDILIWLDKKIQLMLSTKVVAISKYTQNELEKLYGLKSAVIYLGTNFKPSIHYLSNATHYPLTILSVSRLTPYKGFHTLIGVINNLRAQGLNLKLILVGSTPKKNYLNYLKRKITPTDQILIGIDNQKLAKFYYSCDIYVTCDRFLFFGLPIIEAAKFAKPSVCLNFAAAAEVIKDKKTGFIAKNQKDLEKYIKKLALNKPLRQKLGRNAQQLANSKFNWQQIAHQYYKMLKSQNVLQQKIFRRA